MQHGLNLHYDAGWQKRGSGRNYNSKSGTQSQSKIHTLINNIMKYEKKSNPFTCTYFFYMNRICLHGGMYDKEDCWLWSHVLQLKNLCSC